MVEVILAALLAAGPRQHLGPPAPKEAQRVVTLAPSLSEIVLALGARARLVGVTRFDDDPREKDVPRIGGYNDPQPEAVMAVRPDLILAEPAPSNRGPVEALARLGVPVEAFPLSRVQEIEQAIVNIGELLALQKNAHALDEQIESARTNARLQSQKQPKVKTLLVFGLEPLVVAGPKSFAGELLEDAGGENIASQGEAPFFRMSAEAAVQSAPQVIVLCGVESQRPLPGLEKVRTTSLRSTALLHPGPRIPEALQDLAAALRP